MADHLHHLRVAVNYLSQAPYEVALKQASDVFQHQADLAGNPEMFNVTMTVFWMRLTDIARREMAPGATLEEILAARPFLADKKLPMLYYSERRLMSHAARQAFLEPDLHDLPVTLAEIVVPGTNPPPRV